MESLEHARQQLLAGLPVAEQQLDIAGVDTAVLVGGEGPPVVLLHGPGEFAGVWLRVLGGLASRYRVIAPDLPGHGSSTVDQPLSADALLGWLDALIGRTCASPPALVGRITGAAIAARFAARHNDRIRCLVLVDALGLAPFSPQPRFANAMQRFLAAPTTRSYERFMQFCAYDLDDVEQGLGAAWPPLRDYAVGQAQSPAGQAAMGAVIGQFGVEPIPPAELERIRVPTTLVWGRHDMATPVAVAQAASEKYGWPLHIVEDAADDPAFESPQAFLDVVQPRLAIDQAVPGGRAVRP